MGLKKRLSIFWVGVGVGVGVGESVNLRRSLGVCII